MVSATQTQPPFRWLHYVCSYINPKNHVLFTDKVTQNDNLDTCNYLCDNILDAPASATIREKQAQVACFFCCPKEIIY